MFSRGLSSTSIDYIRGDNFEEISVHNRTMILVTTNVPTIMLRYLHTKTSISHEQDTTKCVHISIGVSSTLYSLCSPFSESAILIC